MLHRVNGRGGLAQLVTTQSFRILRRAAHPNVVVRGICSGRSCGAIQLIMSRFSRVSASGSRCSRGRVVGLRSRMLRASRSNAVDHALGVGVSQGIQQLQQDGQTHADRQVRPAFQQIAEFLASDELHRQIHDVILLAVVANPDDAGMAQALTDVRFLPETGRRDARVPA